MTRTSGPLFTFSGVDLGEFGGSGETYTITGFNAATQVFTTSGALTSAFIDYGTTFSADVLSRLTIQFSGIDSNVDNIVVNDYTPAAVTPEPSSLVLLGTGLLGMVGMVRKRFV